MVSDYSPQQQLQLTSKFPAFVLLIAALWPITTDSASTSALRGILFPGKSIN